MKKIGRNDPCSCGSGKKYKKCHGSRASLMAASATVQPSIRAAPTETDSGIQSYLTFSEVRGRPFSPKVLREWMGSFSWDKTFLTLAALSGSLSNDDDSEPDSYAQRVEASLRQLRTDDPIFKSGDSEFGKALSATVAYSKVHPNRPLIHEQAIYFLQAMALLDGGKPDQRAPEHLHLAIMFLLSNDYLSDWSEKDARPLTTLEEVMASVCHAARFNKHPDYLRELARAQLVFSQLPENGPLKNQAGFLTLQRQAFYGRSFDEHFRCFVTPIYFESTRWGQKDIKSGRIVSPTIKAERWMEETALPPDASNAALNDLAMDREFARKELKAKLRADGLPHSPAAIFVRKPFVFLENGDIAACSPWMVREHLRGGLWMRMKSPVQVQHKDGETWMYAFGQMFEGACRTTATEAASSPTFGATLRLSKGIGTEDELEDVVLLDGDVVALFSAKSRLVRADVAREARSRSALVDWYEDFLFELPKGKRRPGALRLLEKKVEFIRTGKVPELPKDAEIFPVLVTFDDLGENEVLYRWVDHRCTELNVLKGQRVAPPHLITLEGLESLLGLLANGHRLADVLREKVKPENRLLSLQEFLRRRYSPDGHLLRLTSISNRFDRFTQEAQAILFPTTIGNGALVSNTAEGKAAGDVARQGGASEPPDDTDDREPR